MRQYPTHFDFDFFWEFYFSFFLEFYLDNVLYALRGGTVAHGDSRPTFPLRKPVAAELFALRITPQSITNLHFHNAHSDLPVTLVRTGDHSINTH
jgi:hypothetical protein